MGIRRRLRLPMEGARTSAKIEKSKGDDVNSDDVGCIRRRRFQIATWPKKDVQTHIAFMIGLNKDRGASGELVSAGAWPEKNGMLIVMSGLPTPSRA